MKKWFTMDVDHILDVVLRHKPYRMKGCVFYGKSTEDKYVVDELGFEYRSDVPMHLVEHLRNLMIDYFEDMDARASLHLKPVLHVEPDVNVAIKTQRIGSFLNYIVEVYTDAQNYSAELETVSDVLRFIEQKINQLMVPNEIRYEEKGEM